MIQISEELRNHFLTDSTKNNLVVDARIKGDGSVDYTNFYTGDVETYSEIMNTRSWNILANRFPESDQFKDYVDMRYFPNRTYFSISFNILIVTSTLVDCILLDRKRRTSTLGTFSKCNKHRGLSCQTKKIYFCGQY